MREKRIVYYKDEQDEVMQFGGSYEGKRGKRGYETRG